MRISHYTGDSIHYLHLALTNRFYHFTAYSTVKLFFFQPDEYQELGPVTFEDCRGLSFVRLSHPFFPNSLISWTPVSSRAKRFLNFLKCKKYQQLAYDEDLVLTSEYILKGLITSIKFAAFLVAIV